MATITTPVWALNFSDDEFNPETLQILQRLSSKVPHMQYVIQPGTSESHGHLTMAHPNLWASHVADVMKLADLTAQERQTDESPRNVERRKRDIDE